MTVRLVGDGPAMEAVRAALDDLSVEVTAGAADELGDADLGVVVGAAGDEAFDSAVEHADRWIAVELGGVGGRAVEGVDAAVSGYGPRTACHRCLRKRVAATVAAESLEATGDDRDDSGENADGANDDSDANDGGASDGSSSDGTGAEAAAADVTDRTKRLAGAIAGNEAVGVLIGEDSISGGVVELPHARRRLLPVPGCACEVRSRATLAGTRSLPVPREYEDRPVEETVARMEQAIDDRVGIVNQVGEIDSFPAPYYLASLSDTTGFSDGDAPDKAAGVDHDWNAALVKAIGESLERYAAAVYRSDAFERAAPADLGADEAVAPASFAGAPDDAPGADDEESLPWVEAEVLTADEENATALVPASAVQFPPPEARSLPAITTGLGLGSSPVGALLSGLTEVVERDAAMLAWYSTFEPLGLEVDDPAFERLARRARGEGLTVTPLLLTQDVDVPVVAVALHREDEWPQFAVASDAAPDPAAAATGALAEAIQNWMELRSTGREGAARLSAAIGDYAEFPEAAREFVDPERTVPVDEVLQEEPPTGEAALEAVLDELQSAGCEAYAARLTTPDLADLGFEAVRAVVPAAQPLFTRSQRFGERAETVPEELGFEPRLDRALHPYP